LCALSSLVTLRPDLADGKSDFVAGEELEDTDSLRLHLMYLMKSIYCKLRKTRRWEGHGREGKGREGKRNAVESSRMNVYIRKKHGSTIFNLWRQRS
jgi:hypothetical protein